MGAFSDNLKEWFGYTRRERRSSFILLFIAVAVFGARYIVPERNIPFSVLASEVSDPQTMMADTATRGKEEPRRPASWKKTETKHRIDINLSDSSGLVALPGIGPVLSVRIIKYRNLLGGYNSVDQLKEVYGLSQETFDLIRPMISADTSIVSRIRINRADFRELLRHPYLEKNEVSAILRYRELEGPVRSFDDLTGNRLLSFEKAEKLKPYFDFTP